MRSVFTECDHFRNEGTVTSPNYPDEYPANYENTWLLTVGQAQTVSLHIEVLQLEGAPIADGSEDANVEYNHGYSDVPCRYDWIRVRTHILLIFNSSSILYVCKFVNLCQIYAKWKQIDLGVNVSLAARYTR